MLWPPSSLGSAGELPPAEREPRSRDLDSGSRRMRRLSRAADATAQAAWASLKAIHEKGRCPMRSVVLGTALTVLAISVATVGGQDATRAEMEVLQAQAQWLKAATTRDVKTLEMMIADELTYGHTTGDVDTKTWYLDQVGIGRYQRLTPDDMKVRVYGDAAVVTGRLGITLATAGRKPSDLTVRILQVYVKRDGRWQWAHHQAVRLAEPQSAGR